MREIEITPGFIRAVLSLMEKYGRHPEDPEKNRAIAMEYDPQKDKYTRREYSR